MYVGAACRSIHSPACMQVLVLACVQDPGLCSYASVMLVVRLTRYSTASFEYQFASEESSTLPCRILNT